MFYMIIDYYISARPRAESADRRSNAHDQSPMEGLGRRAKLPDRLRRTALLDTVRSLLEEHRAQGRIDVAFDREWLSGFRHLSGPAPGPGAALVLLALDGGKMVNG